MSIVKITTSDKPQSCEAGKSARFQFSVSNASGRQLRYGAEIRPDDSDSHWIDLEGNMEGDLPESVDTTLLVVAAPPKDLLPMDSAEKEYSFRLRIYDVNDPSTSVDSRTVSIRVKPAAVKLNKPKWPWITAAVCASLVLIGVIVWVFAPTKVPNFREKQYAKIENALDAFDVVYTTGYLLSETDFVEVPIADYSQGTVYSQSLEAGSSIPKTEDGERPELTLVLAFPPAIVPNVVGTNLSEVDETLSGAQLVLGIVSYRSVGEMQAGSPVLEQLPVKDVKVVPGSTVNVVVSEQKIPVPNLFGFMLGDARNALETLGLRVKTKSRAPGNNTVGSVLNSDPPPTTKVKPGSTVALFVATGPVKVPAVVGKKFSDAKKQLNNLGFVVTENPQYKAKASLKVTAQSKPPHRSINFGSTIELTYDKSRRFVPIVALPPKNIQVINMNSLKMLRQAKAVDKNAKK